MKKVTVLLTIAMMFLSISNVNAALVDLGNGVLFDAENDQYWFQDVANFVNHSYPQAIAAISNLNDSGSAFLDPRWGEWHMASYEEMEDLWTQEASVLLYSFNGIDWDSERRWVNGWYDLEYAPIHHYQGVVSNYLRSGIVKEDLDYWYAGSYDGYIGVGAWVTADATVPIPSAIWLLGSGLIGLVGFRKKFKN